MQQGRFEEAEAVLKKLHSRKDLAYDSHDSQSQLEFQQLQAQIELDREMAANRDRWGLFKTHGNRKRLPVATILM